MPYRLALAFALLFVTTMACGSGGDKAALPASPMPRTIHISGSGTALPLVQKLAEAYSHEHLEARFDFRTGTNSGGAIRGVLDGTLNLAVTNRPLSSAEAQQQLEYVVFAQDAVAFSANLAQPLPGLTVAQLQDIYAGRTTDWAQLGGPAGAIRVLDRDEDESMRQLVLLPLLSGTPVEAKTIVLSSAGGMLTALQNTPNALGYTSLGLFRIQRPKDPQILALDGVMPNAEAVARGAPIPGIFPSAWSVP